MGENEIQQRQLDFLIKGLPLKIRLKIYKKLKEDIGMKTVANLLEKDRGYESLRKLNYTDNDIAEYMAAISAKFTDVNNIMIQNRRRPLFENPEDTYECSKKYTELLRTRGAAELEKIFGATYEEYVPEVYDAPSKDDGRQ